MYHNVMSLIQSGAQVGGSGGDLVLSSPVSGDMVRWESIYGGCDSYRAVQLSSQPTAG